MMVCPLCIFFSEMSGGGEGGNVDDSWDLDGGGGGWRDTRRVLLSIFIHISVMVCPFLNFMT